MKRLMKRAKYASCTCKAHRAEEATKLIGFDIAGMITLKDNETGKEYR